MRSEIRNGRTVHVLVPKEFVNKFTVSGMSNMKLVYITYKELLCFFRIV